MCAYVKVGQTHGSQVDNVITGWYFVGAGWWFREGAWLQSIQMTKQANLPNLNLAITVGGLVMRISPQNI
jgi:hypothetical protein